MPSIDSYYPPNSPKRNELALDLFRETEYRKEGYLDALRYYRGDHDNSNGVGSNNDIVINLVKITADRTVQFLFPRMPKFELDLSQLENIASEDYIIKTFEANGGLSFLVRLSILGFLSGHNFVKVSMPTDSRYRAYPKFTIVDPLSVNVYWRDNDINDVIWYEVRYSIGDSDFIEDIVHIRDDIWAIVTYTAAGQFINRQVHISPLPPIIDWAHYPSVLGYYGVSEFGQKSLQDKINVIANTLHKVTLSHAEPKDIIIGSSVEDIDTKTEGNLYSIENALAKVVRLEVSGDMGGIGKTLDRLVETYLNVARVVLLRGEPMDLQRVTNAAVRTLFLDALAKREILISTYSRGLTDIAKTVLLIGYSRGALASNMFDADLRINFTAPLPMDMSEIVNQNALMLDGGYMSKATAATRMGLDWQLENALLSNESPAIPLTENTNNVTIE